MSSQDPTLVIILSEIIIFQALVIAILIALFIVKKRKKAMLLMKITTEVSEATNKREDAIRNSLKGIPSVSEDQLKMVAQAAVKDEVLFYQYIVDTLHDNKSDQIELLKESVENLVSPYTLLATSGEGNTSIKEENEQPVIPNVDDAIDDLLGEDFDEQNKDPELDLGGQNGIAEIPDDLLEVDNGDKG